MPNGNGCFIWGHKKVLKSGGGDGCTTLDACNAIELSSLKCLKLYILLNVFNKKKRCTQGLLKMQLPALFSRNHGSAGLGSTKDLLLKFFKRVEARRSGGERGGLDQDGDSGG